MKDFEINESSKDELCILEYVQRQKIVHSKVHVVRVVHYATIMQNHRSWIFSNSSVRVQCKKLFNFYYYLEQRKAPKDKPQYPV